jgi:hypothetical protein
MASQAITTMIRIDATIKHRTRTTCGRARIIASFSPTVAERSLLIRETFGGSGERDFGPESFYVESRLFAG